MTAAPDRHIPDRLTTPAARALRSWEAVLIAVAIAVFVTNSFASPYFLNAWNLSDATFNFTETDLAGTVLRRSRGNEYIHPDWRLFFSGPSEWDGGDGTYLPIDGSPVQFIFPDEPGFASTQPLFDCDAVMSSLSLPPKS